MAESGPIVNSEYREEQFFIMRKSLKLFLGLSCIPFVFNSPVQGQSNSYSQKNLVSDSTGAGPVKDPNLINPWGVAFFPGAPFWVSDNNSGFSTLYDKNGNIQSLVVKIPPPTGSSNPATPTGIVANNDPSATDFSVNYNGTIAPSAFIFSTEDGTISGWNGGAGGSSTNAILAVDNSAKPSPAAGAVYKGLAMITNSTGTFLLVANFRSGKVEVYDVNFKSAVLAGSFTDLTPPAVPAGSGSPGWAPFGIHVINNQVVVTYALQDAPMHDPLHIAGAGFVDLFDLNGNMLRRITMDSHLNAPWGAVMAPQSFGAFGGKLLVGNFGDGTIDAFDLTTGNFIDQMKQANGTVITNLSLWDLVFDPTGKTGDPNTLYFTAGGMNEAQGLFGAITASPATPPATPDFNISASPTTLTIAAGQPASFTVTLGGLNGFNSAVSLACSGQPLGSTCTLSPMSVSPSSGGTATSMVTIGTSSNPYQLMASGKANNPASTLFAMLLPIPAVGFLGLMIGGSGDKRRFRGRKWLHSLTGSLLLVIATACLLGAGGCYSKKTATGTQRGTTTVMITGTSGSVTHSTSVTVTVQ
jgi:uncharacterized protein (TIGR03118 family)